MTGERMGEVEHVDLSHIPAGLDRCSITVACDVANPLLGPQGAARSTLRRRAQQPTSRSAGTVHGTHDRRHGVCHRTQGA